LEKSVRENITLHNLRRVSQGPWLSSSQENAVAEEYKTRLAIRAPSIQAPVHQLSGGNQQKVILSKILLAEPRVIFLDEPTKGIDVGAKSEIYRLIFDLARDGVSFVLISSELPELLALCDRFIVLARGRITGRLERAEANEENIMAAATG
jgi:ABC-type sugar transport system ATPase subunit